MDRLTPAMRQYMEIKARYEDAILFFRMGDFYEMFFEDARIASRVLGIALTSRDRERKIPMCGVPYHAVQSYIAKLIKEGYKVAICEQVEDPRDAKTIVRREVVRVVTPGTVLEDEMLEASKPNYIASALWNRKKGGLAFMELSTGEFKLTEFEEPGELADELERLEPSELLLPDEKMKELIFSGRDSRTEGLNITYVGTSCFSHDGAQRLLTEHFGVATLDGFGCAGMEEAIKCAGALLRYVKDTHRSGLGHIKRCTPYRREQQLFMDASTQRNLELFCNLRNLSRDGTLISVLDETSTAMGGRRLRQWLRAPLVDPSQIRLRLDAVEELVERAIEREEIRKLLSAVYDVERLTARLSTGYITPPELLSLKHSLEVVRELKTLLESFYTQLIHGIHLSLDPVDEAIGLIASAIADEPPSHTRDGGFIKEGYSEELDELRRIGTGGKDWIARLESRERQRTGIPTLKVGYNRVFGYYIEVTKANLANVPSDYIRRQTLVNAERFVTPELKEWESKILGAEQRAKGLESELYTELLCRLREYIPRLQNTAELIATLDVLVGFATIADDRGYTKPEVNTDDAIIIEEGRHPVVELSTQEGFVANDTLLDLKENQILIITGPNMAGKSTYLRQVALIVIMAQMGSFVPARSATIGVVDRIFTRIGASDELTRGQSTFMVEMSETANILNNATPRSLIILDEIGRGTATFDGLSIAWAVAEYLHDNPRVRAKTLFATHYHELTELSLTKERVKNYNMAVREWQGRVVFLRKILPGGASGSYGIQVARLAGLPEEVVERAKEILKNLEQTELTEKGEPRLSRPHKPADTKAQLNLPNLFKPSEDPVKRELKRVDVNHITPVEALNILERLKKLADEKRD